MGVGEWRKRGYPNERDLFSLRLLLILLSLNDLVTARAFWDAVNAGLQLPAPGAPSVSDQAPIPELPVQCGTLLLCAAEQKSVAAAKSLEFFRMVRAKYHLVIRRDPSFEKFLDEIEGKIFGAQVQRQGIGALFEMLLGGAGVSDSSDGP